MRPPARSNIMLTRIRRKSKTIHFVAMWLIAMAAVFVAPGACAMECTLPGAPEIVRVQADAPSCHPTPPQAPVPDHCGSGGPCCPPSDAAGPSAGGAEPCFTVAAHPADSTLTSTEAPTLELMAAFLPAPAPWVFLATRSIPFTPARLLPPREPLARPHPSRAPPTSLI